MFSRMCRSFKDQVELAQICDGTECRDSIPEELHDRLPRSQSRKKIKSAGFLSS